MPYISGCQSVGFGLKDAELPSNPLQDSASIALAKFYVELHARIY